MSQELGTSKSCLTSIWETGLARAKGHVQKWVGEACRRGRMGQNVRSPQKEAEDLVLMLQSLLHNPSWNNGLAGSGKLNGAGTTEEDRISPTLY